MKTKKNYVAASLVLAQLVFPCSNILAQDKSGKLLDEVVITASRSPRRISEIGKVVRVINSETISRSQGRTLPELLNNVAGLTIGGNGGNNADVKAVYLRGASAANTLILLDGIPVNDASEISGEYNISAIAIDNIERIEILKGGNSTLYGSDAVAGVINIITRKGNGELSANILGTAGSYNTFKQAIGLNGQLSNTSISINASNTDAKNFSSALPANSQTGFDKDGFHQKSFQLNLGQKVSDRFSLRANVQANNNQADLDNGAFADAKDYTYGKSAFVAGLGAKFDLDKGTLNLSINQNSVQNYYNNRGSVTNNGGDITHLESNFNYAFNNYIDLASGISYRNLKTDQYNPYGAPLFADNNIKSVFSSFFLRAGKGLQAEIGGRLNSHSEYGSNLTYTLNPSYLIADKYKVFINVSSAYRVPSLYQLFSDYGNLELQPETSTTYEAGFDMNFSKYMNFSVSYFKRDIESVIDFGQIAAGRFGYINQNFQKDKGFEAELDLKPLSILNLNAYYAFVDGEVTTPASKFNNLFRRPKHSYGLNAGIDLSNKISMNLIFKHTGERKDRYYDGASFKTIEADLNSFNLLDVYLQFKPTDKLTLFTDIKNVLDENYVEYAGYQTRGLNFNAGFSLVIK